MWSNFEEAVGQANIKKRASDGQVTVLSWLIFCIFYNLIVHPFKILFTTIHGLFILKLYKGGTTHSGMRLSDGIAITGQASWSPPAPRSPVLVIVVIRRSGALVRPSIYRAMLVVTGLFYLLWGSAIPNITS